MMRPLVPPLAAGLSPYVPGRSIEAVRRGLGLLAKAAATVVVADPSLGGPRAGARTDR